MFISAISGKMLDFQAWIFVINGEELDVLVTVQVTSIFVGIVCVILFDIGWGLGG